MKRIALYARVSTHEQDSEQQITRLREYAKARGLEIAGEFVDHGLSGKNTRRPQYQALMKLARGRKVDAIAVVKLDRWGRSTSDLIASTLELSELGVAFISIDGSIDLSTSAGRLQFQMLAAFAEFERELIRERTIEGLKAAKRRGKKLGNRYSTKITPGQAVRAHVEEGLSFKKIGERYGVTASTAYRAYERGIPQNPLLGEQLSA